LSFSGLSGKSHLERKMFFDDPVSVARYDQQKYSIFEKLTKRQWGYYWDPNEVPVNKDSRDFKSLIPHEQHIFTGNLKRQIILDTKQGTAPSLAFLPIVSLPELEAWIQVWTAFESIHSRSYSHIIRNIYPDPSKVFDEMVSIQEIVDCARDISKHYDDLIETNNSMSLWTVKPSYNDMMAAKTKLWLTLHAVNALEGIRFYVSFACSWAFAERNLMEGNAKIIKLIARDENLHLAATQHMLKLLPNDDPDFAVVRDLSLNRVRKIYQDVVEQEKQWASYLFKDGSIIGLNERLLHDYVDWISHKRMKSAGVEPGYKVGHANPLPWTERWIAGHDVQPAPQEVNQSSYVVGRVNNDVSKSTFAGMTL
jgi:ribonucleoside-diphosphate reductase beta chain